MNPAAGHGSKLQVLQGQFVARCGSDKQLLQAWLDGAGQGDSSAQEQVRKLAHRLAGAAAVFGHPALAQAAEALEDATLAEHATSDALALHVGAVVDLIGRLA